MNKIISVVIRNKNEAKALENVLSILKRLYFSEINEIVMVDNNSTDNSVEIAKKYNCKVITIDNFSYGRAINIGIQASISKYVLLLSSHAIPVGANFFKNTLVALKSANNIAGVRYINSIENYKRAIQNDFEVTEPLKYGLMAGCCIVNKEIWEQYKFNENLVFSEDKEWSDRVVKNGFKILDINETFFYFIKRDQKSILNRYKNETIAEYQLNKKEFPSPIRFITSFFKKILITNNMRYFKTLVNDFSILKIKFKIHEKLKTND